MSRKGCAAPQDLEYAQDRWGRSAARSRHKAAPTGEMQALMWGLPAMGREAALITLWANASGRPEHRPGAWVGCRAEHRARGLGSQRETQRKQYREHYLLHVRPPGHRFNIPCSPQGQTHSVGPSTGPAQGSGCGPSTAQSAYAVIEHIHNSSDAASSLLFIMTSMVQVCPS